MKSAIRKEIPIHVPAGQVIQILIPAFRASPKHQKPMTTINPLRPKLPAIDFPLRWRVTSIPFPKGCCLRLQRRVRVSVIKSHSITETPRNLPVLSHGFRRMERAIGVGDRAGFAKSTPLDPSAEAADVTGSPGTLMSSP